MEEGIDLNNFDERSTALLLAQLDKEIDLKCKVLKEKHQELRFKKMFFVSCIAIMLIFFLQIIFQFFNMNYLVIILVYQATAALFIIPVIMSMSRGRVTR